MATRQLIHYVTTQTCPATCQKSKHPSNNERNKMLSKKCTLFRGELSKAQNNIRLIKYPIEDAGRMEKVSMLSQACTHKLQRRGKSDIYHQPLRKSTPLLRSTITHTKWKLRTVTLVTDIRTPPNPRCRLPRNATQENRRWRRFPPISLSFKYWLIFGTF